MNIPLNDAISDTKKKFLTTKYNEVNVRNGPGLNHLKIYKILKKGYPLKIIDKFENWKKVTDVFGMIGWVSNTQLSENRYLIVTSVEDFIFKFPNDDSKKIAKVRKNYILENSKCTETWCFIKENQIKGWIKKKSTWGGGDN